MTTDNGTPGTPTKLTREGYAREIEILEAEERRTWYAFATELANSARRERLAKLATHSEATGHNRHLSILRAAHTRTMRQVMLLTRDWIYQEARDHDDG